MKAKELFELSDKTAIVTGGMGQLGIIYSNVLVDAGAKVAIFDRSKKPIINNSVFESNLEKEKIQAFDVDITSKKSILSCLEKVVDKCGIPHILINNAALDSPPNSPPEENGPFETYPESSYDKVMEVNVKGTLLCCQAVGALMAEEGRGSIINISSMYGNLSPRQDIYDFRRKKGEVFFKPVAYSVSKSAILNLTRYLATYWAKSGVRVNTMSLHGVFNNQPKEFLEAYCPHVPMGRMAKAEEMAGTIIYLASEASSYVTGSNLVIDGGWSAW